MASVRSAGATARQRSRGGVGLGLALVRGLVELHGGQVSADSAGLGKGTEITVRLPLTDAAAAPEAQPGVPGAASPTRRVLVIEDNRDAAESMRTLLTLHGHEVEIATAGRAGLAAARTFRPQVVLCDIGLPGGMDGYAVARAIRDDASLAAVRLIALSGYGQEEDRRRSREVGFDEHVIKPVNFTDLSRMLVSPALPSP